MNESNARFSVLRQSADTDTVVAMELLVREGSDSQLNRINVLDFAARNNLNEERAIAAFLQASKLGLFDLSWNLLCPGCGCVLDANATLKTMCKAEYHCSICAAGYEPTLDEMVEVSFTVSPRVRRIAAHDPNTLPYWEYVKQITWSSGIEFPADEEFNSLSSEILVDNVELSPGEKCLLSVQIPLNHIIVFEPVTHSAQHISVQGEPARDRQELSIVYNKVQSPTAAMQLRPGSLRLSLENRTDNRVLPALFIIGDAFYSLLGKRKRFLTAKRLVTNQTFQDIYRTDTLDVDQRLKITSMTFLFTDLKGSTELYERVGDLAAYDLVRAHFGVLNEVVAAEAGAVVKTIGDAVMATFPTPDRALAAALRMREAIQNLNDKGKHEDLLVKIGIHEGPCLAVTLNDRMDYFGQTVNIAARVQGLAVSKSIFATEPIVTNPEASHLLAERGLQAIEQRHVLRGLAKEYTVYEIP